MKVGAQRAKVRYSGLGKLIRERRVELGMTQAQLGEFVGRPQDYVSKVELGSVTTRPDSEIVDRFAAALDLPRAMLEDAESREEARVSDQLAELWSVGTNPVLELNELLPRLKRDDLRTLVRLARVMIAGREAGR